MKHKDFLGLTLTKYYKIVNNNYVDEFMSKVIRNHKNKVSLSRIWNQFFNDLICFISVFE